MIFLRVLEGPLLHENIGWTHPVYNFNCYQFILFLDNFYWRVVDLQCASFKCTQSESVISSVQFSSVAQSCPTLCDPMDCGMPGYPVHHQLPKLAQTYVHQVSDAIQPSHLLSSPSPPAFNVSQHHDLFQWVSTLHHVARVSALSSVLPMNIQDRFSLGLTGLILQSKGLSRVFSNTTLRVIHIHIFILF